MRIVDASLISDTVARLFIKAAYTPDAELRATLKCAEQCERTDACRAALKSLSENLDAAERIGVPICQDTGMAVVFADVGRDVHVEGATLFDAVNAGVRKGYTEGYMRLSVVSDPLYGRVNTNDNTPAILHIRSVEGDKITLTCAPKGFGSENMSAIKMMEPSATEDDVIDFIVSVVKNAGANPCPPIVLGVGIGGDFEHCAVMAKRALTRPLGDKNADERYARLEEKILSAVNAVGIGAAGFGGSVTALAVKCEFYPTHIAGLPVAININCHAVRHESAVI